MIGARSLRGSRIPHPPTPSQWPRRTTRPPSPWTSSSPPAPAAASAYPGRGRRRWSGSRTGRFWSLFVEQVIPLLSARHASTLSYQYLASVASVTTSEHTEVKKLSEAASGDGSKKSDEAGTSRKPNRGGPVSWLSLLLLIVTGGGIIVYYDKEKKRHIEEKKAGIEIVPVFISVDPERDTVEQVHDYVKEFHPDLIGLTGTSDEVRQVARAYRVYFMKTEEEGSDYLVDHSIVMYLMDPNMEFTKFFGKNYGEDELADGIIKEITEYNLVKR